MVVAHEDMGGDPACWLNRVCETCGRFIEDEFARTCNHCGAPRDLGGPHGDAEPAGREPAHGQ